ncbi:MAG: C10 family peptidase [Desulfobacterales bacterium]|nr:C10 family peptidase [Desulfobacterales bacterium]
MSRWSQTTVDGQACYNYYTPPNATGDYSNYPCGCVATAMAQLMRYWQYPASPVVGTFDITVDDNPQTATIRGGNGSGGNYAWGSMVLDPINSGVNLTQRQAIGALTFDAGISVNMDYAYGNSSAPLPLYSLVDTFRYSNSKHGWNYDSWGDNIPDAMRNAMVIPNLHAKYPVLFGITAFGGGHAIVCDGYGYNASTMYHHLNMGWSGNDDLWYNLPNIDTTIANFNAVTACVYNVYTSGSGEIIAGRVTNSSGTTPISGASVSATGGYTATTDAKGIYALVKLPSYTTYTVNVTKTGYTFSPRTVSTGESIDLTSTGNLWGIDFVAGESKKSIEGVYQLLLMN